MREIMLKRNRGVALVDDEDYEALSQYIWHFSKGYAARSGGGKTLLMHREILDAQPGQIVDHRDRNRLNNQRSNLRIVTYSQNNANVGLQRNNTTGYRGVSLDPRTGRYLACVKINKKTYQIGQFRQAKKAAIARDAFAILLYGIEYAYLNCPEFWEDID